jgi:hypothetical protein
LSFSENYPDSNNATSLARSSSLFLFYKIFLVYSIGFSLNCTRFFFAN